MLRSWTRIGKVAETKLLANVKSQSIDCALKLCVALTDIHPSSGQQHHLQTWCHCAAHNAMCDHLLDELGHEGEALWAKADGRSRPHLFPDHSTNWRAIFESYSASLTSLVNPHVVPHKVDLVQLAIDFLTDSTLAVGLGKGHRTTSSCQRSRNPTVSVAFWWSVNSGQIDQIYWKPTLCHRQNPPIISSLLTELLHQAGPHNVNRLLDELYIVSQKQQALSVCKDHSQNSSKDSFTIA